MPSIKAAVHSINSLVWQIALDAPSLSPDHPPGAIFPSQLSLALGRTVLLQQAVHLMSAEAALMGPGLSVQPLGSGNVSAGSTAQFLVASAVQGWSQLNADHWLLV